MKMMGTGTTSSISILEPTQKNQKVSIEKKDPPNRHRVKNISTEGDNIVVKSLHAQKTKATRRPTHLNP